MPADRLILRHAAGFFSAPQLQANQLYTANEQSTWLICSAFPHFEYHFVEGVTTGAHAPPTPGICFATRRSPSVDRAADFASCWSTSATSAKVEGRTYPRLERGKAARAAKESIFDLFQGGLAPWCQQAFWA